MSMTTENQFKFILVCILVIAIIAALIPVLIVMTKESNRLKTREADNKKVADQYRELLTYERANHLRPTPPPSCGVGISGCRWMIPHETQVKHFAALQSK